MKLLWIHKDEWNIIKDDRIPHEGINDGIVFRTPEEHKRLVDDKRYPVKDWICFFTLQD